MLGIFFIPPTICVTSVSGSATVFDICLGLLLLIPALMIGLGLIGLGIQELRDKVINHWFVSYGSIIAGVVLVIAVLMLGTSWLFELVILL